MKKFFITTMVAGVLASGCTGSFKLTKSLHSWQTSFENKWVDEVAFLGCVILPVYGFATLGDAIIFNSVEFWSGENPLDTVSIEKNGQKAQVAFMEDGKVRIETENGKVLFLEKTENGVNAKDADGTTLYSSTTQG
jgi:hypothetical protein